MSNSANGQDPESAAPGGPSDYRVLLLEAMQLQMVAFQNPVVAMRMGFTIATDPDPGRYVPLAAIEEAKRMREIRAKAQEEADAPRIVRVPSVVPVGGG